MEWKAKWITNSNEIGDVCPVFRKDWAVSKRVAKAELVITALGVYEAFLNGQRVSQDVLMPGWTAYDKRLQYQIYDITELLHSENRLEITVGKGWFSSPMPGWMDTADKARREKRPRGVLAEIRLSFENDREEVIATDASWLWGESRIRFSELYDGEFCDACFVTEKWEQAAVLDWSYEILIPQEGEPICEMECVSAKEIIRTPAGEVLIDFGQEVTGYVEISLAAKAGDMVSILHGEVLDKAGNFYNENYRSAKAALTYICRDGQQRWHPELTFFGFRYIKLEEYPVEPALDQFKAIVVYSRIRKTGTLKCSNPKVNQLFSNIFWGQKGNYLDVPTDCPQRDERLGWTGDAQVFVKAASYNYDVERFFRKWMRDMAADQRENGAIGQVIPDYLPEGGPSSAWGDAAVIIPWQIYLTYGNRKVLKDQFASMKKWVDYITSATTTPYLWTGGEHFGDWLGLDAPIGSYKGSSREDFIATAYYAYSTGILIKAGKVIGQDVSEYEKLYRNIVKAFRKAYPEYKTQTEHILAVHFRLAEDPQKTADDLAERILADGCQIRTGFVGTPYILHVLSEFGHNDLAYALFLREEYPSWLFSVRQGATTIWEHWDGIMENGDFWSPDMNSFNHYAYGAVADWVYEKAAGICLLEDAPGFSRVRIHPMPDKRLDWLEASIETRNGKIRSCWKYEDHGIRYEISVPVEAEIQIGQKVMIVKPGEYIFWD